MFTTLRHFSLAINYKLKLTYVDASDLEDEMKTLNPVKYHEAWRILCQCHGKCRR
jgi:CTP synthase